MKEIELTPDPHLLESMRAVGYTVETAVADLMDNSIAAGARCIDVLVSPTGNFRLSIVDDGCGMDRATALDAMRLAAKSPGQVRREDDLGRFGLGLKTASLSQCRRLTLATKRDGVITILRWDLDHVLHSESWSVIELDSSASASLLGWHMFDGLESGTLVSWENLDLFGMTEGTDQADFDRALVRVRAHCELVFHRFVSGDGVNQVELRFNGSPVASLDPFLTTSKASSSRRETIRVGGAELKVTAHTLPHLNKMTATQKRAAQASGPLRDSQGFYIYRGGRLVIWGTWFRLNPKGELGKLARVKVDVPNSLDHLWALDIKKSQATPPREIRDALRNLAGRMIEPSKRVHTYRGRKLKADDSMVRLWDLVVERESEFRYEVNRNHVTVQRVADGLDPKAVSSLNDLLDMLESTFPLLDAHNRLSQDGITSQAQSIDDVIRHALGLRPIFEGSHPHEEDFVDMLLGMEPFGSTNDFRETYLKHVTGAQGGAS